MDKPISMSTKDYLVRVMSLKTNIPVKTIDAIVVHQMEGAYEATKKHDTIEISGFGKFIFNESKAKKKWEKHLSKERVFREILEKPELTEDRRRSISMKLESTLKWMEGIKPKIEKCQQLENT
jgi:nucleoid DNA-binding protein